MDILSDVNVTGRLNITAKDRQSLGLSVTGVSSFEERSIFYETIQINSSRIQMNGCYGTISVSRNDNSNFIYDDIHTTKISGKRLYLGFDKIIYSPKEDLFSIPDDYNILTKNVVIQVPPDCTKFEILYFNVYSPLIQICGCSFECVDVGEELYSYPVLSAFHAGRKVEIDYEITGSKAGPDKKFSEIIYGITTTCSESRNIYIAMNFGVSDIGICGG